MRHFIRIACFAALAAIFGSFTVFADPGDKVFDDKEYGYSISHPGSWDAEIYRSGVVVANVTTRTHESGISVRIYRYDGKKEGFKKQYVADVIADLKARLISQDEKKKDGLEILDIELMTLKRKPHYGLLHRLIFFPDQKRVFVMQAGYPAGSDLGVVDVLRTVMDSLKIYDKNKLMRAK